MPQTSFSTNPVVGQTGQLVDQQPYECVSKVVGGSANIPAGRFVVRGTDTDAEAVLPSATTDITGGKALGFALWTPTHINPTGATNTERTSYIPDEEMPVVRKGVLWLRCEDNFTAGSKVFVRFTANGAGKLVGQIRSDADTDKAVALPNARFESSGSADGLAMVRFSVEPTGT